MDALWFYNPSKGIQELYIVVNKDPVEDRNVVFNTPPILPWKYFPELGLHPMTSEGADSWGYWEDRLMKSMKDFKKQRAEDRKREMEGTRNLSLS